MDRRDFLIKSALVTSGLLGAGLVPGSAAAKKSAKEKTRHPNLFRIDSYCHFSSPEIITFLENAVQNPNPEHHPTPPPGIPPYRHPFNDLFANTRGLTNVEERLELMDRNGIDMSILVPLPWIETIPPPYITREVSKGAAELLNDQLTAIVNTYPDRFRAVALLPTLDKDQMLAEFERAVGMGMVGGFFVCGKPMKRPDHEDYFSLLGDNNNLYGKAVELDVPLWLHPSTPPIIPDYLDETESKFQIWQALTWLHDSSAAMVRMVFAGVFEKHPDLKMIIHHHGALIPLFHHRMTYGWDYFEQNNGTTLSDIVSKPYIEPFKNFYCDTATQGHDPLLIQTALDFFGPDRLCFGSDAPMDATSGDIFTQGARTSVEALNLRMPDLRKIYHGNIARLIKLTT